MGLPEISRDLDALIADLAAVQTHLDRASAARRSGTTSSTWHDLTWSEASAIAQIDALNVRVDALTAEVRTYETRTRRRARRLRPAG